MALALGKTVGELEQTLSAVELEEWIIYFGLEPLPDSWIQTAQICAVMANCWSKRRHRVEDFLPRPADPQRLTPEQSANLLKKALQN